MFPQHLVELIGSVDPRENDRLTHTTAYQAIEARRDADTVLNALAVSAEILDQPVVSLETLIKLDERLSHALGKAAIKTYEAAVMMELAKVANCVNTKLAMARATRAFVLAESSLQSVSPADTDSIHKLRDIMSEAQEMQDTITSAQQNLTTEELAAAA